MRGAAVDFIAFWEIFLKILLPALLAYGAYLHRQLAALSQKFEELQEAYYDFRAQSSRDYATHATVRDLENRLTAVLNRIDDKVTRILERERNG